MNEIHPETAAGPLAPISAERGMKLISIMTPCYNEEENVEETYRQIKAIFESLGKYRYEHLFIDNASTDNTQAILRRLAAQDKNVKVIINTRNFGHIRSPFHGLLETSGDAVIVVVADRQDPLDLIPLFLQKWEEGHKIVMAVKKWSHEHPVMFVIRKVYYKLVRWLSEIELTENYYGYGLFDRFVIDTLRKMDDSYPYGRGMVAEIGCQPVKFEYTQRRRERGITKNNFYTLYDMAMLGITSHSKIPLRLATMLGFGMSAASLLVAVAYLVYKILFWNRFEVGIAPVVIGIFLISAVQLFFIGIVGEYIGAIHTQVLHRPLVVEQERINFDS
jgi:glycosyltransferase involved in cell wall biosynthesis